MFVSACVCDVTVEDDVQGLIDCATAEMGRIDVLFNNAGLGGTEELVDITDEQWLGVIDVTLNGTLRNAKSTIPTRSSPTLS